MDKQRNKNKLWTFMYILAFCVFLLESVVSIWGISPFLRIGLFLLAMIFVFAGSRAEIKDAELQKKQRVVKRTMWILFFLFLLLFFSLVFVDSYFKNDIRADAANRAISFSEYKENYMSLIPFKSTRGLLYSYSRGWIDYKAPLVNIAGNLLLCMPFAFFLPLLFKKQRKFIIFLPTVFAISLLVESIQLVTKRGFCDIDDLILNVAGAVLLFLVLHIKLVKKFMNKITFDLY